jgi:hypothetical protein
MHGGVKSFRMESLRKAPLHKTGTTYNGITLIIDRLRLKRLGNTFKPNLNHSQWKESEWNASETRLALTGITQNGITQNRKTKKEKTQ